MKNKTIIVSGADSYRFDAHVNHKNYADANNIDYHFFLSTGLKNPFFTKCYAILDAFDKGYDYVFWVDDDAFFIDSEWDLLSIFNRHVEDIVVTQGRSKKSGITLFNNGIMFIKKTRQTRELFETIPKITTKELKRNWIEEWGPCEGNDQPRMIYLTQTRYPEIVKIYEYPGFNAHEITFKQSKSFLSTNPPMAHITGQNKKDKLRRFEETTKIDLFNVQSTKRPG